MLNVLSTGSVIVVVLVFRHGKDSGTLILIFCCASIHMFWVNVKMAPNHPTAVDNQARSTSNHLDDGAYQDIAHKGLVLSTYVRRPW